MTGGGFDAAARRTFEAALRTGEVPRCPFCDVELSRQEVARTQEVAYVRHRVWLLCPTCRRSASVDLKA